MNTLVEKEVNTSSLKNVILDLESFLEELEQTREKSHMIGALVKMILELEDIHTNFETSNMTELVYKAINEDLEEECMELERIIDDISKAFGKNPLEIQHKTDILIN